MTETTTLACFAMLLFVAMIAGAWIGIVIDRAQHYPTIELKKPKRRKGKGGSDGQ